MNIVCLDMEGVPVPEIWIAFSEASGIPELRRTTRDEPDYDELMTWRLGILKEHGLGLKSWYYHMNGLNVAAGDRVEQGQQIGRVGSTGFSTGPHLHFALSVNQVFVNPWTPMEGAAG